MQLQNFYTKLDTKNRINCDFDVKIKRGEYMTLRACLEIANDCGLETVGEAIYNIDLHAGNIFDYSKINIEMKELVDEAKDLFSKTNLTKDSLVEKVLEWIGIEDDDIDEKELNL